MIDPSSPAIATPAGARWLPLGVVALGVASAGLLLWALGDRAFAAGFLAIFVALSGLAWLFARSRGGQGGAAVRNDRALLNAAIENDADAVAITDRTGQLICANRRYQDWFDGLPTPPGVTLAEEDTARLAAAGRTAWREGSAAVSGLGSAFGGFAAHMTRAGLAEDHLVWRFSSAEARDLVAEAGRLIEGEGGRRLALAGIMTALVDGRGRLVAADRVFVSRALGDPEAGVAERDLVDLVVAGDDGLLRFAADGADGAALRVVQVPVDDRADAPMLFLLLDGEAGPSTLRPGGTSTATENVHALLAMLPLGLALAERDGRFLFMNDAFRRAANVPRGETVLYPSDLVIAEDKAAVSDAVRRFAAGRRAAGDLAVRLAARPDEPVALTIAAAKGLGEAAVLLSLKDNSEESKLKRQVAQATKMQAVGQLAGGVAHDFNNILTAIIGHCDLMMMRHAPGDSDYDDIQQIKQNSNRAAGLTRQLLAFSRQQTLRPQVLQLPDVISEISNLVKRLLGETVTLVVKHGRNLGPVRADPGQLEQVIVNLAVNGRDAMISKGGGTLTLQTYAVSAADVRAIGSDIMPVTEYTALSVSDTGTGIPPEILGKIFEPFFTTKEVGRGTGLGLSTVYGIVKQSGGFIFADSKPGAGTSFVLYLPVYRAEQVAETRPKPRFRQGELWGSGTILLVEDEDMVRAVAERALTRQGYTVLAAANGEEALEMLDRVGAGAIEGTAGIDLLISDVVMPAMDGPTLVRHARGRFPDLPILFMSGYAEEQLRRSIDLDRVVFLPKPFSVQQLAQAARDALALKTL
ncbi:MAG TPA: ATP-binding protein [Sphingomonadaceae bacterium]|nr:ATP-binding protein [Sphingomonadaceae bacterium]